MGLALTGRLYGIAQGISLTNSDKAHEEFPGGCQCAFGSQARVDRLDEAEAYGDCPKLLSIRGPIFRFLL